MKALQRHRGLSSSARSPTFSFVFAIHNILLLFLAPSFSCVVCSQRHLQFLSPSICHHLYSQHDLFPSPSLSVISSIPSTISCFSFLLSLVSYIPYYLFSLFISYLPSPPSGNSHLSSWWILPNYAVSNFSQITKLWLISSLL